MARIFCGAEFVFRGAQPTIRTRIEALEASLGVVLFTRSVRGLVLTKQARELGVSARAMARASAAFVRAAAAPPGEVAGVVRLDVSEMIGIEVLPPILARLRAPHPSLIIEIDLSNASANGIIRRPTTRLMKAASNVPFINSRKIFVVT